MSEIKDLKSRLIEDFKNYESRLNGEKDGALHRLRREAINIFDEKGFPTRKNEEWKYVNLAFLRKINFNMSVDDKIDTIPQEIIDEHILEGVNENLLVFINGKFAEEYSKLVTEGAKVKIGSLAKAIRRKDHALIEHYGKYLKFDNHPFAAINTAFANDGAYIRIDAGVQVEEPVHILYLVDARKGPVMSPFRNLYLIGKNANVKIIESTYTIGSNEGLANIMTEAYLDERAVLDHIKLQDDRDNGYYVGMMQAHQEQQSVLYNSTISLSGAFVRNDMNTFFNNQYCEANYYGIYFLKDGNFVDNHTLVDHAKPNCNSNELYKGILDNNSTAVFNGKIIVRQDAQKTNAYQQNRNILMDDDSRINTKPQLEIYADDVKCSHGATTGKLDDDMLFYLRSRGISDKQAKSILLHAFLSEVTDLIKIEKLRETITHRVAKRLNLDL